jgi:hypothetical protein
MPGETLDRYRLGRSLALVAFVTAVFLLLAAERLPGDLFPIGAVAIGAVAVVTAIAAFLVAATDYWTATERLE